MTREGATGRRPDPRRSSPSRSKRSRAAAPTRVGPADGDSAGGWQSPVTARAAILVLVLASVMVAVALPFKIWLGQRGEMASLTAQTRQTQARLDRLDAMDQRWQNPAYVESQANKRLHYTLPGHKTRVVLGPARPTAQSGSNQQAAITTGPWYSQFWQSVETAGKTTAVK
jgi:hypothetical protein